MGQYSKRLREVKKTTSKDQTFPLEVAIDGISKFPKVKFDETVELHFFLNIKAAEQSVRGTVVLPHGLGKKISVAVFCKGEMEQRPKTLELNSLAHKI